MGAFVVEVSGICVVDVVPILLVVVEIEEDSFPRLDSVVTGEEDELLLLVTVVVEGGSVVEMGTASVVLVVVRDIPILTAREELKSRSRSRIRAPNLHLDAIFGEVLQDHHQLQGDGP